MKIHGVLIITLLYDPFYKACESNILYNEVIFSTFAISILYLKDFDMISVIFRCKGGGIIYLGV